jgi:colanic acid/amylovoran biosynthesis glycosyltransferase
MDNINLVVSALKALRRPNKKLLLTQKFIDGMALYRELRKKPVTLVCGPTDEAGNNLDNVEVDIETAPFRVVCQDYSSAKIASLLRKKAVVLLAIRERRNGISRICNRTHVPCVYITKFSLRTRLDIIKAVKCSASRSEIA